MTTALCPGSFDPPTNGHIDIIERCASMFDRVVVAVVTNPAKDPMFTIDERIDLLGASIASATVEFRAFSGLLVDFVDELGVDVVIKGIRASDDFDHELQMSQMNAHLTGMQTMFLPTNPEWGFVSSSLVREVARLGGSVQTLVPRPVAAALEEKLA